MGESDTLGSGLDRLDSLTPLTDGPLTNSFRLQPYQGNKLATIAAAIANPWAHVATVPTSSATWDTRCLPLPSRSPLR
jgi:hypothetical protein